MWEWILVAGALVGIYALSQPYLTWRHRRQDQM